MSVGYLENFFNLQFVYPLFYSEDAIMYLLRKRDDNNGVAKSMLIVNHSVVNHSGSKLSNEIR